MSGSASPGSRGTGGSRNAWARSGGKEWLIGVAPPGDLSDDASPRVEDIVAFRVPGDCVIKLHVATWHAGPHFVHDECLFFNLENLDTNRRDFHAAVLPVECRYRL